MSDNRCLFCDAIIPEGRQLCPSCNPFEKAGKRPKYHNRKIRDGDTVFDSVKEHRRWCELKILLKAGKISDLKRQVRYVLIPAQRDVYGKLLERECAYIADFVYTDNATGDVIVEDTKGMRTKEYVIKRKLMLKEYGIRIREV